MSAHSHSSLGPLYEVMLSTIWTVRSVAKTKAAAQWLLLMWSGKKMEIAWPTRRSPINTLISRKR